MKLKRIQHRRLSQTGPLQFSIIVRLDVFEDGQHIGAVDPAVFPLFLLREQVEIVDLLLNCGGYRTDVEASLALRVNSPRKPNEDVEDVVVRTRTQQLEELNDVGLRERKRRVERQRREIDPLHDMHQLELPRSEDAAERPWKEFGGKDRRESPLPDEWRINESRIGHTA